MLDLESDAMSPFMIPQEDVEILLASEGFWMLRNYLARDTSFCAQHDECDSHTKETWILHRDLLHALVMPVLELFNRASTLAEAALCTRKSEDLELAFSGDARGAFLCLQCFVDEEEDWCRTRGCPACITSATLSTESHLRLTIAASLLSTSPIAIPPSTTTTNTTNTTTTTATATATATAKTAKTSSSLPPLPHILPALRTALASDPLWGPSHWPYLHSRATQLCLGIQALMRESLDLESLVSSSSSSSSARNTCSAVFNGSGTGTGSSSATNTNTGGAGVRLRKSKLAKRQLRLERDELELLQRVAVMCWARARVRGGGGGGVRTTGGGGGVRTTGGGRDEDHVVVGAAVRPRRRSLTCP